MKNSGIIGGAFLLILGMFSVMFAQGGPYPIADVNGDITVIQTPQDINVNVGDRFYIVRSDGLKEYTLAVAEVERFKGVYCRLKIVDQILRTDVRKGDYLLAYDPAKYSYLDDILGGVNASQNPAPAQQQPQTDYSSLSSSGTSSGADLTFTIFTGVGSSNFNRQELYGNNESFAQSAYIPIGAQLLFGVSIVQFGAEFNYAVMPFSFKISGTNGTELAEDEIDQIQFGGVLRVNLMKGPIKPFVRGGAGVYAGDYTRKFITQNNGTATPADQTIELNNDFGFNFGAGLSINNGFFEFVYHMVDRSTTVPSINGAGQATTQEIKVRGDNWAVQGGVQFSFSLSGQ